MNFNKLRMVAAIKIAGTVGGSEYRDDVLRLMRYAEERMNSMNVVPDFEDRTVALLAELHARPNITARQRVEWLGAIIFMWEKDGVV